MRIQRIDTILRWLRSCALCGSFWPPIDLFCSSCASRLHSCLNRDEQMRQEGYPFPVYSLMTWTDENDAIVRGFVHGFKGGWSYRTAAHLLENFSLKRLSHGSIADPRFFFPPPSAPGKLDHSWLVAAELARQWQVGSPLMLSRGGQTHQKQKLKTAQERAMQRFLPVTAEKISFVGNPAIFVDDVITTGSTAMAAYMALGDPERFEAWTLVCRPKLAGKSRI